MTPKLLLPLLLCSISLVAQTPFLSIPNDLKSDNRTAREAFAVVNDENESFAIFLDDDKTLNGYLYSNDLQPIAQFSSQGLPEMYTEIMGQTVKDKQIRLFLKNENNRDFGSVLFDFEGGESLQAEIDFKLKGEIYLQSHSYKDKFYLLTVTKRSSILNIYTFEHEGEITKKSFDFGNKYFVDRENKPAQLYELLTAYSRRSKTEISIAKIDETSPNSIDITSHVGKFYDRGDKFILSIDESILYTYLFEFTAPELSVALNSIKKSPRLGSEILDKNNSYLFEDKIFQISGNSNGLVFSVKDLKTNKELKKIELTKYDEIDSKYGSDIQEVEDVEAEQRKVIEKTFKFLKTMASEDMGVSVIPVKKGYHIIIGGQNTNLDVKTSMMKGPGGPNGFTMDGAVSGIPIFSAGYFTVYNAYLNYKYSRNNQIESWFDSNLEHIDGIIPQNDFDKISAFALHNPNAKAENVFKLGDLFVYGKYNSIDDTYELFKFSE